MMKAKVISLADYKQARKVSLDRPLERTMVFGALSWMMAFSAVLVLSTMFLPKGDSNARHD
jgi:hypothetical protein